MQLDDLLECHPEKMEKLTDKELTELVMPFWTVSRPSMAPKPTASVKKTFTPEEKIKQQKMQKAREIALAMGIKI